MERSPLIRLPAEIRLHIYKHVFKPVPLDIARYIDHEEVDLLYAEQAFDKSLLTSCRAIYREAWEVYTSAYRDFWLTSNFVIDIGHTGDNARGTSRDHDWDLFLDPERVKKQVLSLKAEALRHISSLTMRSFLHHHGETASIIDWYKLLDQRGGWIYCPDADRGPSFAPRRHVTREDGMVRVYCHDSEESLRTWLSESCCECQHMTMHHQILKFLELTYNRGDGPVFEHGFCSNDSSMPRPLQDGNLEAHSNFSARQVGPFHQYSDGKCLLV